MFITKRELNRRIDAALAERERERYVNERIYDVERRIERNTEDIWRAIHDIKRQLETDIVWGEVDDAKCLRVNT